MARKWAIVENSSVYIPGDERSRTNPGHGYPEHTVTYDSYKEFDNYDKFVETVTQKHLRGEKFKILSVEEMQVSTKVEVKASTPIYR